MTSPYHPGLSIERGILTREIPIPLIFSADVPIPAERPKVSVLDKASARTTLDFVSVHWMANLGITLGEYKATSGIAVISPPGIPAPAFQMQSKKCLASARPERARSEVVSSA